ncbi:hypothetical protein [Maridesulfovibrio sp.]|uniref:hypothetical protein n=1 Tax=Maridesulfovibrio sp. TaxID=2795000 RepID=UPI002AA8E037|nr:hypothetical protein [Maridesulfovibrio sp.]
MVMDGVKGRFEAGGERAHTTSHPPIIKAGKFKPNIGELPAGQVLQRVANLLEPFTGAEGEIMIGVLDAPLDTASETVGEYVVHGTVKDRLLTKDNGTALDTADHFKLYEIGIYPE